MPAAVVAAVYARYGVAATRWSTLDGRLSLLTYRRSALPTYARRLQRRWQRTSVSPPQHQSSDGLWTASALPARALVVEHHDDGLADRRVLRERRQNEHGRRSAALFRQRVHARKRRPLVTCCAALACASPFRSRRSGDFSGPAPGANASWRQYLYRPSYSSRSSAPATGSGAAVQVCRAGTQTLQRGWPSARTAQRGRGSKVRSVDPGTSEKQRQFGAARRTPSRLDEAPRTRAGPA